MTPERAGAITPGEAAVGFRLRIVRYGIQSQWMGLVLLVAYSVVTRLDEPKSHWWPLVVGLTATFAITLVIPWAKVLRQPWGMKALLTWSVCDIVLVAIGNHVTGGGRSAAFLLYGVLAIFFAAMFTVTVQGFLLCASLASYGVMLWANDFDVNAGDVIVRVGVLVMATFLAGQLSREIGRQREVQAASDAESFRRAELLATVTRAAREMTLLGPEEILDVVVDTVIELGFATAGISMFSDDRQTYMMSHTRGLPEGFTKVPHPASGGMTGIASTTGRTFTIENYSDYERGLPELRALGLGAAISAPVFAEGIMVGVLHGQSDQERALSEQEVEVFEILALQAGHALEGARRLEFERRTVTRLEELDKMKTDFLTMVSHELRTPLTAIQGMGRTLEERWDELDNDLKMELIGRLNANAATLHGIISTLLDFSRIEAGRFEVHLTQLDLRSLVYDVADRLKGMFVNHPWSASVETGMVVVADPVLLERVIENLIANAVIHTPADTRVALAATHEGDSIRISVSDSGPGIAPDDLKRIGERFFRGGNPNTRPSGGTGLGLAFVREVLKLHGSSLELDSNPGSGTTFTFKLRGIRSAEAGISSLSE